MFWEHKFTSEIAHVFYIKSAKSTPDFENHDWIMVRKGQKMKIFNSIDTKEVTIEEYISSIRKLCPFRE